MARIWMTGLEAGHMDVFDSYNAAINAVTVRTGAYSLYIDDYHYAAGAAFASNVTEFFGRFGLCATYSETGVILVLFDSVGDIQITLSLNGNTHAIEGRRGGAGGTLLALGGCIHQDRWHCIEFHLLVDDAPGGVFQLKVDGTQVIDFTGDTQATANANVLSFRFCGASTIFQACSGYYDDIAFNDTAGGVNATWIGRGGIPAIFPTGAGNSTDLNPSAGANWQCVDEVPPNDDTDYVSSAVVDDHDSYAASNLAATGTISAVQWLARAKSDLVGNPEIARILRIGGDHQGADIAIDATYDYYAEILDQDPQAGPGAWTVAAVNGMELGVKIR